MNVLTMHREDPIPDLTHDSPLRRASSAAESKLRAAQSGDFHRRMR
jgi:hypothetical protein